MDKLKSFAGKFGKTAANLTTGKDGGDGKDKPDKKADGDSKDKTVEAKKASAAKSRFSLNFLNRKKETKEEQAAAQARKIMSLNMDSTKIELSAAGNYHTHKITAAGNPAGQAGQFHWYRATDVGKGQFTSIMESDSNTYQPTIEDIGARICCQWQPKDGLPSRFAEIGPVVADPVVEKTAMDMLASGQAVFPATDTEKQSCLLIVKQDTLTVRQTLDSDPIESFLFSPDVEVQLTEAEPSLLMIQDARQFKSWEGHVKDRNARDIVGLLVRKLCQDEEEPTEKSKSPGASDKPVPSSDVSTSTTSPDGSSSGNTTTTAATATAASNPAAQPTETSTNGHDLPASAKENGGSSNGHSSSENNENGTATNNGSSPSPSEAKSQASSPNPSVQQGQGGSVVLQPSEHQALLREMRELREERDTFRNEVKRLRRMHTETEHELKEKLSGVTKEKDETVGELHRQVNKLQLDVKNEKSQRESVQEDMDTLRKTLQSVTVQMAQTTASEQSLVKQISLERSSKDSLKALLDKAEADAKAAHEENKDLKAQAEKVSADKMESVEKELKKVNELNKKLTDELARARVSTGLEEKEKLTTELEQLTENLANERKAKQDALDRAAQLGDKVIAMRQEKMALDEKVKEMNEKRKKRKEKNIAMKQEFNELKIAHMQILQVHQANEAKLKDLEAKVQSMEETKKADEAAIAKLKEEVTEKVTEGKHALDEAIANRNHWKQKAESLRTHLNVLLPKVGANKIAKEAKMAAAIQEQQAAAAQAQAQAGADGQAPSGGTSAPDAALMAEKVELLKQNMELSKQAEAMRAEAKSSNSAIEAYKKAFEAQLLKLKMEREANVVLSNAANSDKSGMQQQYIQLRNLANNLSETIADKDVAMSHMRQANKILGSRVRELEERFRVELAMEEDESPYNPSKRNLLMDEKALGIDDAGSPTPTSRTQSAGNAATSGNSFISSGSHSRRESKDLGPSTSGASHGVGTGNLPMLPPLTPGTPGLSAQSRFGLGGTSNANATPVGLRKDSLDVGTPKSSEKDPKSASSSPAKKT